MRPIQLSPDSEYRLVLVSDSTTAVTLDALWSRTLKDAPKIVIAIRAEHSAGDRTRETFSAATGGGYLWALSSSTATGVKRGRMFAELQIGEKGRHLSLAKGYITATHGLQMGQFEDSLSGKGYLNWVQEANDAAGNATTTINLAQSNSRRLVRGVIAKYHSSGDAATRTLTITLRDLADSGGPTGWSIASDTYVSPTLTLTADEEGLIHIGEHGFVSTNDAGTLAYADNSSAPNPFPMEVEDTETGDLIVAAGSGNANDDYDVWVQYEEWIDI